MPIPSHFIGHAGHARTTNPMPIPSKKYLRFMLYISSIFLVSPPLSVGHPAPPFTPLVRPRTAVCSRGARARRERSGSGAPADRYSGGHRAAAAHASTSAAHTAHTAGELPVSSRHPPPILHAARSAVACGTERPPPGRAPARPALSDAGVSRPRGLSPRHGRRRGGFALMRIAPAKAGVILRRDTPAERRAIGGARSGACHSA